MTHTHLSDKNNGKWQQHIKRIQQCIVKSYKEG